MMARPGGSTVTASSPHANSHAVSAHAADPGYTKTDFNNHTGYRTVEQAADTIVWLAG
jgi:hypothetical protein